MNVCLSVDQMESEVLRIGVNLLKVDLLYCCFSLIITTDLIDLARQKVLGDSLTVLATRLSRALAAGWRMFSANVWSHPAAEVRRFLLTDLFKNLDVC